MLAFTNPVAGREAEFNTWYDDVHVKDLLAIRGIAAAQRFMVVPTGDATAPPHQYLAMYRLDAPVEEVRANLAVDRDRRVISEAFGPGAVMWGFRPLGPAVTG
jgi:hypothetical protein